MAKGRKTGGRVKGTPNKLTGAFKTDVLEAHHRLGGVDALLKWAKDNQTAFYQIATRLIPTEISGPEGAPIPVSFHDHLLTSGSTVAG